MNNHVATLRERLVAMYETHDTDSLRSLRDFVDLFPPVDSTAALGRWETARADLESRRTRLAAAFGDRLADIATVATAEMAMRALSLYETYQTGVDVLVLDVDETLRSAGTTDNEIPRESRHLLTELHDRGVPIVICTGQTLENVKGFLIQGLGSEIVHSGTLSVVYEAGNGVFTPGHGGDTKRLLYERLDPSVQRVFDEVRIRALSDAPRPVARGCHLQGNEFSVTLKPNYATGSDRAGSLIDEALLHQVDTVGVAVGERVAPNTSTGTAQDWARAYYAQADPEIATVLGDLADVPEDAAIPTEVTDLFGLIDVAYYEGDAAEVTSLELDKVAGVEAAYEVLGLEAPFALVMGDSKSDLRVMEWVESTGDGISGAPRHATEAVVDHVRRTDGLVFDRGDAATPLRTVSALNTLAGFEE